MASRLMLIRKFYLSRVAARKLGFILNEEMSEATQIDSTAAEAQLQRALDFLAAGSAAQAAEAFRRAIDSSAEEDPIRMEAHHGLIRALRDAGRVEASIAAALALTALTPQDPLAHTALAIALQHGGHVPEAEAASARARILEWKQQLQSPPDENSPL